MPKLFYLLLSVVFSAKMIDKVFKINTNIFDDRDLN